MSLSTVSLETRVERMGDVKSIGTALRLLRMALPIWNEFAGGRTVRYRDSVVGMEHTISVDFLERSVEAMEHHQTNPWIFRLFQRSRLLRSMSTFDDAVVSLQDLDMEWPEPVSLTFYATHNLMHHIIIGSPTASGHSHVYVSINQSIDALERSGLANTNDIRSFLGNV